MFTISEVLKSQKDRQLPGFFATFSHEEKELKKSIKNF